MKKRSYLFSSLIAAGLMCFAGFALIGSHVNDQGIVEEPFGLIPIGWLLVSVGVTGFIISGLGLICKKFCKIRQNEKHIRTL